MAEAVPCIYGPIRLVWHDGSTAAIVEKDADIETIPIGVTFAPTEDYDEDGRQIYREWMGTIH